MTDVIKPSAHDGGTVYHTDLLTLCGELIRRGQKVDMILCDLPYGTTACSWDTIIPFEPMWAAFKRIIKPRGAIVLTASQPFTSALVMSNPKMFRYEWIWEKSKGVGFLDANRRPLKWHENVLIFYEYFGTYTPQGIKQIKPQRSGAANKLGSVYGVRNGGKPDAEYMRELENYPRSILHIDGCDSGLHPTQKPVNLFRYLIRTYTRPGELVFDPCVGSGTTAIAARAENRRYIVGDISAEYVAVTREQLRNPFDSHYVIKVDKPLDKPVVQIGDDVLEQTTLFD